MNTKPTERTQPHKEKKKHLKINRPGIIKQPVAESDLSNLGKFQAENSCDHK